MPTPAVIEATSADIALIGTAGDVWRPIFNGSNIYAIGKNLIISSGVSHLRMFKSTDNGATWTAQDTASEPIITGSINNPQKIAGSKIGIVYIKSGATGMVFRKFNMTTDLWEAESPQSTELPNFTDWRELSSGDIIAVYQKQFGGPYSVHLDTYNGVAWAGPTTVVTAATERIFLSMAVDTADNTYIATLEKGASLPHSENVRIYATGVVGAPTTMATYNNPQIQWGPGIYIATSDEIRFPFILRGEAVSGFSSPGYWSGTPSAAPVWTLVDLALTNGDPGPFSEVNFTFENDNDIFISWATEIDSMTGQVQILYARQQSLGAWGPAIVLWDSLADPLSPPSAFPGDVDFLGTAVDATSSQLGSVLALYQDFPIIGGFCGVLYYLATPLTPAPLTLDCPSGGTTATVGVFYDEFLQVTGGTPPYFFEIIP
jgi:hypothetical protein